MNSSSTSGTSDTIPRNYRLQYTCEQIDKRVNELGLKVGVWAEEVWNKSQKDIVAVPILRGALLFSADLLRAVKRSIEICPIHASAYDIGVNQASIEGVKIQASTMNVKGRAILLMDDICDSGKTLEVLKAHFEGLGAQAVRSAVLIKRVHGAATFQPDWCAFEYNGPEWFVGYGMDDHDRFRNLSDVYIIQK